MIVLSIVGTCAIYPYLPDNIPKQWNVRGEVISFTDKMNVFLLATIPAFIYIMFIFLPKIDPKKDNSITKDKSYLKITSSIIFVMITLHWLSILYSLDLVDHVATYLFSIIGLLLYIIGIHLKDLHMNYFGGIKLPWALENELVWKKTHIFAGNGFLMISLISILTALFDTYLNFYYFSGLTLLLLLSTVLYSYILSKTLK